MWSDNETVRDLVNFSHVAEIAAERIVGAKGEPISLGISGDWGVGKSSMMKLLRTSLEAREDVDIRFVEFNAWLYQSYDDARAALMETITATVVEQAVEKKDTLSATARKRAASLFGRVKKLRLLGIAGSALFDYVTQGQITPWVAGGMATMGGLFDGDVTGDDLKKVKELEKPWNDAFHSNWLSLDPPLAGRDLRGALYVGRESHPIISRADELSSDALDVLDMLLRMNSSSTTVDAEVARLTNPEIGRITDKILSKAKQETAWGTPALLNAMQSLAGASPGAEASVVAFLSEIPSSQIKASIVPRINQTDWGKRVLTGFLSRGDLTPQTRRAIAAAGKAN